MINTETIEKKEKTGNRILRKFAMFMVALICCFITTASSSWLTSERVVAVGGVPIIVNKVTVEDINNAKKKPLSAFVDSQRRSSTPSRPISPILVKSIIFPSMGETSILKSPVWNTLPTGVFKQIAHASAIEWLT